MVAGRENTLPRHAPKPAAGPGGFTLIELLVVIAIIALLMAILIPTLSRVRRQARGMICQSRLRQWGMVLGAYTEANEGRLPTNAMGLDGLWLLRGAFISSDRNDDPNVPQDSFHHFHTRDIVCCPVATEPIVKGGFIGGGESAFGGSYRIKGTSGSTFGAWEITTPAPAFRGSYGFNQWFFRGFSERPGRSRGQLVEWDVLSFSGRADLPILLDAAAPWSDPRSIMSQPPPDPDVGLSPGIREFCLDRHNACVNGLFLDWSVRPVGLKKLWTLKWSNEFDTAGPWTRAGGVTPEDWPKWMRRFKDY